MKVLVCGGRDWPYFSPIRRELKKLPEGTIIIHGAARGADTCADIVAKSLGFEVKPYPADWEKYGKAAGPIRNLQMLKENPDIEFVLAFHSDIESSKGTKHMKKAAEKAGIEVRVIIE